MPNDEAAHLFHNLNQLDAGKLSTRRLSRVLMEELARVVIARSLQRAQPAQLSCVSADLRPRAGAQSSAKLSIASRSFQHSVGEKECCCSAPNALYNRGSSARPAPARANC